MTHAVGAACGSRRMGVLATLEREIDRLYALPLDEFTSARNELARRLGATCPPVAYAPPNSCPMAGHGIDRSVEREVIVDMEWPAARGV